MVDLTPSELNDEKCISLDPHLGWPKKAVHHFDRKQIVAILAAKAIRRPLLVRGEPGCGKTQLARAAAQLFQMPLAWLVVNERTETEDLFWRYDALARLSDANSKTGVKSEEHYLSAGPLWWALNPENAKNYEGRHSCKPYFGEGQHERSSDNGVLLLIDEIDKADRSVPNSLLEALGNYSFYVPYINQRIECTETQVPPFIVITTNGEQELPPAFVRRCLVLDMVLDDSSEDAFKAQLVKRGKAALPDCFDNDSTYQKIAEQLWEKRKGVKDSGVHMLPGQAEYFDHLEAVKAMKLLLPESTENDLIKELSELTYDKYRV